MKSTEVFDYDKLPCESNSEELIQLAHLFSLLDHALCEVYKCSQAVSIVLRDKDGANYSASLLTHIDSGGFGAVFGGSLPVNLDSSSEAQRSTGRAVRKSGEKGSESREDSMPPPMPVPPKRQKVSLPERQLHRGVPSCALKLGLTEDLVREMKHTPKDVNFPLTLYSVASKLPLAVEAHMPRVKRKEGEISCLVTPLGIPWKTKRVRILKVNSSAWVSLLDQIIAGHMEKNVCHRDVRRSNILLIPNATGSTDKGDVLIQSTSDCQQQWCRVKLIDWGCAKDLGLTSEYHGSPETRPRRLLCGNSYTPRVEDSVEQLLLTFLTVVAGRSPPQGKELEFWTETIKEYELSPLGAALKHIDDRHVEYSGEEYKGEKSTDEFYQFLRHQLSLLPDLTHDGNDAQNKWSPSLNVLVKKEIS